MLKKYKAVIRSCKDLVNGYAGQRQNFGDTWYVTTNGFYNFYNTDGKDDDGYLITCEMLRKYF